MTTEKQMTRNDTRSQLDVVWDALLAYRADLIPEGDPSYDEQWNEICTAMHWLSEDLNFREESATDEA